MATVRLLWIAVVLGLVAAACGADASDQALSEARTTTIPAPVDQSSGAEATSSSVEPEPEPEPGLPDLGAVPPLEGIDGWLQSSVTSLDELRGKVVVVQFWTFGCHNCKATLPNLKSLYAEHAGDDFEIVGIHSPEFEYEEDPEAIAEAAAELGVTWPIALDTLQESFFGWQGSPAYWPRTYVLDREGKVRFDHIGEGAYEELNQAVATLLE